MQVEIGCDGVMIGCGAMGNLWIFCGLSNLDAFWKSTMNELRVTIYWYFDCYVEWVGECKVCLDMCK